MFYCCCCRYRLQFLEARLTTDVWVRSRSSIFSSYDLPSTEHTVNLLNSKFDTQTHDSLQFLENRYHPAGTVRTMYVHCTYSWYNVRTMYVHCTYSARWAGCTGKHKNLFAGRCLFSRRSKKAYEALINRKMSPMWICQGRQSAFSYTMRCSQRHSGSLHGESYRYVFHPS